MAKYWWAMSAGLLAMGAATMLSFLGPIAAVLAFSLGAWGFIAYFLWTSVFDYRIKWSGILISILLVVSSVSYFPSKLAKPQIDESKICLFLQYAYEWNNYLGSENKPGDISRCITDPIEAFYKKEEYRLLLGVHNNNQPKLPITNVLLHVSFFDDSLTVRAETPWRSMRNPNKDAFTLVSPIINSGQGIHPNGSLWIRFPKLGIYTIGYEINGANFEPISGIFKIYLKTELAVDRDILDKLKIVEGTTVGASSDKNPMAIFSRPRD